MPTRKKFNKKVDGLKRNSFKRNQLWKLDMNYVEALIIEAKHGTDPAKRLEAKEALHFLSQFLLEYYDNSGLKDRNALHGKKLRKAIYEAMNATNRDVFSIQQSSSALVYDEIDKISDNPEDAMIDYIDNKRGKKCP